jgi:hypothetical protein
MKFEPGNTVGKGRPRGSRNRLTARIFEDVLSHWNEPIEGRNISKGIAALEVMRKEKPAEYVKIVTSLLPKELVFSDSTVQDLNDEQIDTLIMTLRRQVLGLAAQSDEALN